MIKKFLLAVAFFGALNLNSSANAEYFTTDFSPHFLPAPLMVVGSYTTQKDKSRTNFGTHHRGGLLVTGDATYIGVGIKSGSYPSWTRQCILSNDGYASINIPAVKNLPEADLLGAFSGQPMSDDNKTYLISSETDSEHYQNKAQVAINKGRLTLDTSYEAPLINEFPISFLCKLDREITVTEQGRNAENILMVFKVLRTFVDESYISEKGDNAKINPIVGTDTSTGLTYFAHPTHGYFGYGEFLGKPGLSTSKTATDFIITEANNEAEMIFLLTPEGSNADTDAAMTANKLTGAVNHTNIAENKTANFNLAGVSGTGFSIDITLTNIPAGNSGIIGINKYCYLTEENLGDLFDYAYAAFSKSKEIENAGGWRELTSADFKNAGLSVKAIAANSNTPYDITPYISAGAFLSGDDTIILSYGTVLIDGALTDNEGQVLAINPEEGGEATMHDGVADGKISTTWYVEAVSSTIDAIPEEDNKAEFYFVSTPEELNDTKAQASLENNKIKFLTSKDILSGGTSEVREIKDSDKEIEDGGFKMSIPLNSKDLVDGYAPALGIQRMFVFTAENIGTERFNALKTAIASREKKSNGFLTERPSTKVLTNSGIHIFASYPDNATSSIARVAGVEDRDVSDEIDFNLMQNGDDSIVMGYGAIIVDRALTSSSEGGKFESSYETTRIASDGAADYVLTAEWYMTKTAVVNDDDDDGIAKAQGPGSSSGGCTAYSWPGIFLAALLILGLKNFHSAR